MQVMTLTHHSVGESDSQHQECCPDNPQTARLPRELGKLMEVREGQLLWSCGVSMHVSMLDGINFEPCVPLSRAVCEDCLILLQQHESCYST